MSPQNGKLEDRQDRWGAARVRVSQFIRGPRTRTSEATADEQRRDQEEDSEDQQRQAHLPTRMPTRMLVTVAVAGVPGRRPPMRDVQPPGPMLDEDQHISRRRIPLFVFRPSVHLDDLPAVYGAALQMAWSAAPRSASSSVNGRSQRATTKEHQKPTKPLPKDGMIAGHE
jgi:hypothetical protein